MKQRSAGLPVISVSRRTDIPAFFAQEFLQDLDRGEISVANPFNPIQVRRVSLKAEDLAGFVFWTRNPAPFFKVLDRLDAETIPYYFLVTHTGYPQFLEPRGLVSEELFPALAHLCGRIGPERIIWRYDPVVFCRGLDPARHLENFTRLAERLQGVTNRVIVSFLDLYARVKKRLAAAGIEVTPASEIPLEAADLLAAMLQMSQRLGLEMQSCCDPLVTEMSAVPAGKCIDEEIFNRCFGLSLTYQQDPNQRDHCRCHRSIDIGRYHTCPAGCVYCYAL